MDLTTTDIIFIVILSIPAIGVIFIIYYEWKYGIPEYIERERRYIERMKELKREELFKETTKKENKRWI